MDNFPIQCMVCDKQLKGDQAYLQHMKQEHGTTSTTKALAKDKAIKQNVPQSVPIGKDIPPSDEFMEIAKQIDSKPPVVRTDISNSVSVPSVMQQQEVKPLELKYRWEGNCPKCNTPIKTVVIKPMGKWFAVAFCLAHEEITQQEVDPLIKEEEIQMAKPERLQIDINEKYYEKPLSVRKRGVKHVKRSKSKLRNNSTVSPTVPTSRLSEAYKQSVQS